MNIFMTFISSFWLYVRHHQKILSGYILDYFYMIKKYDLHCVYNDYTKQYCYHKLVERVVEALKRVQIARKDVSKLYKMHA